MGGTVSAVCAPAIATQATADFNVLVEQVEESADRRSRRGSVQVGLQEVRVPFDEIKGVFPGTARTIPAPLMQEGVGFTPQIYASLLKRMEDAVAPALAEYFRQGREIAQRIRDKDGGDQARPDELDALTRPVDTSFEEAADAVKQFCAAHEIHYTQVAFLRGLLPEPGWIPEERPETEEEQADYDQEHGTWLVFYIANPTSIANGERRRSSKRKPMVPALPGGDDVDDPLGGDRTPPTAEGPRSPVPVHVRAKSEHMNLDEFP